MHVLYTAVLLRCVQTRSSVCVFVCLCVKTSVLRTRRLTFGHCAAVEKRAFGYRKDCTFINVHYIVILMMISCKYDVGISAATHSVSGAFDFHPHRRLFTFQHVHDFRNMHTLYASHIIRTYIKNMYIYYIYSGIFNSFKVTLTRKFFIIVKFVKFNWMCLALKTISIYRKFC